MNPGTTENKKRCYGMSNGTKCSYATTDENTISFLINPMLQHGVCIPGSSGASALIACWL